MGIEGLIQDLKEGVRPNDLKFWADGFKHDYRSPMELLEAFRSDPQEKRFHRDVIFSGVKLNGEVVGFVCLEKPPTSDIYKTFVVALKASEDYRESRLIKVAVKQHRDALSFQRELSTDFVGNLTEGAAIMGHRVFKALRHREMNRLRSLAPEDYASLLKTVSTYRYPTFTRDERVTLLDVLGYGLRKCGILNAEIRSAQSDPAVRAVIDPQPGGTDAIPIGGMIRPVKVDLQPSSPAAAASFLEDLLSAGTDVKLRVFGASMAPTIRDGDVVIVRNTRPARLRPGDMILFRNRAGAMVLHRILKHGTIGGEAAFHTKGDARHEYDRWVRHTEVLGRAVGIEKKTPSGAFRKLTMDRGRMLLANRLQVPYQRLRSKLYLSVIPRLFPSRRTTEK